MAQAGRRACASPPYGETTPAALPGAHTQDDAGGWLAYAASLCKMLRGCSMQTTLTKRGQTVVPAEIRRRDQVGDGDRLA